MSSRSPDGLNAAPELTAAALPRNAHKHTSYGTSLRGPTRALPSTPTGGRGGERRGGERRRGETRGGEGIKGGEGNRVRGTPIWWAWLVCETRSGRRAARACGRSARSTVRMCPSRTALRDATAAEQALRVRTPASEPAGVHLCCMRRHGRKGKMACTAHPSSRAKH
jgi:hypothetical protein